MTIQSWQMVAPERPLVPAALATPALGFGQALIEVAGCGVCHTDLGFLYGGVKTRHGLPLTLGHEISGRVVGAGEGAQALLGQAVVVPAVLPCGECEACQRGRGTVCPRQVMPGNDLDGGFADRIVVPARYLCPLEGVTDAELPDWSVLADAVSTPYQAVRRSGLQADELAVFVGVGGVGSFGAQIAAAVGASVVALDVDPERLRQAAARGASLALDVRDRDARSVKGELLDFCRNAGVPAMSWKIFETSGTRAGQELAFGLLVPDATLVVVGFTMEKVSLRLSNLMALDARAIGTWGCDPELYPEVVQLVRAGKIDLAGAVERHPLGRVNEILERAHRGELKRRPVLVPGLEEEGGGAENP